jgi:hypothetical protein
MAEHDERVMWAEKITGTVDRLLATLDGLTEAELNWRPSASETNSLFVLAVHTMANVEENVIEIIGGEPVGRNREEEFVAAGGSSAEIQQRWAGIRERVTSALANLPQSALDEERTHFRRGTVTVREVLLVAATHASEHAGQAELTRDLLKSQP